MIENMTDSSSWLDADIDALELSSEEKSGLQVYRNYTRSFDEHAIKRVRAELDEGALDLTDFKKVAALIATEDIRFLPVIACGFADVELRRAFTVSIPAKVPGGVKALLTGFGPLADFASRIKLAFAFDILSPDLMLSLDRVRQARNRIAHDWDTSKTAELAEAAGSDLHPVEEQLAEQASEYPELALALDTAATVRVRLIWLLGRIVYEASAYHVAKDHRVPPRNTLYGDGGTKWLGEVSSACLLATLTVIQKFREGQGTSPSAS